MHMTIFIQFSYNDQNCSIYPIEKGHLIGVKIILSHEGTDMVNS